MKIGWGTGITLFYISFVLTFLFILKKSKEFDHSLVVSDYYKHDLNYQAHYEKLSNSEALQNPLKVKMRRESETLEIVFPKGIEDIQGTVLLFRPSDQAMDFLVPIRVSKKNIQSISTKELAKGLWTIKVNWSGGETPFYSEQKIVIS